MPLRQRASKKKKKIKRKNREEVIDLDEATIIIPSQEELIGLDEATNITPRRDFLLCLHYYSYASILRIRAGLYIQRHSHECILNHSSIDKTAGVH